MVIRQPTHQTDGTSGALSPPSICQHPTVPTCTPGIAGTLVCWKGAPFRGRWRALGEPQGTGMGSGTPIPKLRGLSGVLRGWDKVGQSPAPTGMPACCRPPMGAEDLGVSLGPLRPQELAFLPSLSGQRVEEERVTAEQIPQQPPPNYL